MIAMRKAWAFLALLTMAASPALFVGCAKEVGDIDRTQSIILDKADFAGVWYYVRTVADVPFSTSMTFQGETYSGSSEGTAKIVFDVQEDLLLAYPVYEKVDGVEAKYHRRTIRKYWDLEAAKRGKPDFVELYVGQPIAAWTIQSHFDVIYDYNAQTGEPTNVKVENTTDKPWWERKYMRVDWNSEQIGDIAFVTGQVDARSLQFVEEQEQAPLSPDAPEIYDGYIGVVTKYYAEPNAAGCAVWGLYRTDCTGAVIKVRHSFRRANPSEDAVIRRYTNREQQDKFGFFLAERNDFDPLYGYTEAGRDYKAQLWNLWQKSQAWEDYTDANGNTVSCVTQVDCPSGTRCMATEWFKDGICKVGTPLPYAERGLRPIIYHMSHSHPGLLPTVPVLDEEGDLQAYEDPKDEQQYPLYEGGHVMASSETGHPHPFIIEAYETADGWSKAFKETVAWLLYHEKAGTLTVTDMAEGARSCTTSADCIAANPAVIADHFADTDASADFACAKSDECPSGFSCVTLDECNAAESVCNLCAKQLTCDASNPCPVGSSCTGGLCVAPDGQPHYDIASGLEPRAYTFVVYANSDDEVVVSRLTDRVLPAGVSSESLQGGNQAAIRFVNTDPGQMVSLRAVTADPADSAQDSSVQTDTLFQNVGVYPSDRADEERMLGYRMPVYTDQNFPYAYRGAQKWRRLEVVADGVVLATLHNVDLAPARQYLFVYGDGQLIASDNAGTAQGIRVIDAVPSSVKSALDFGVDSLVLGRQVEFGTVIPHERPIVNGVNRFVVLEAGARGDVVCYDDNTIGKCVGWGPILGTAAKDEAAAIEASLPEMFVLCEPIYHGDDCTDAEMGNLSVYNDCRYSKRNDDGTISNPCKDFVPAPFSLKKIGDIRYSPFYWVEKAQAASPLGYGPSAADPEFGNTFYGIANIYGGPLYTFGRYSVDILDLMNGNLAYDEVMTGEYVRKYILAKQEEFPDPSTIESEFEGLMLGTTLSGNHVDTPPSSEFTPMQLPPVLGDLMDRFPKSEVQSYRDFTRTIAQTQMRPRILPSHHPMATNDRSKRLEMVLGTHVADLLMNDEATVAATGGALTPGMMIPDEQFNDIALAAIDPDRFARLEAQRNQLLASKNIYMADFTDDSLVGFVKELGCTQEKLEQGYTEITSYLEATKELERKKADNKLGWLEPSDKICLTGDALNVIVTARIYGGVLEHEVGHTVGLRHNFAGSGDVFNFADEWYQIRERERVYCYDETSCDDTRGQVCMQRCATNADCPSIATCDDVGGGKVCVDKSDGRGDFVGWCMAPANVTVPQADCTFNPNSTAPGTAVRVWSQADSACFLQTYCTKNIHCGLGQTCNNSFCTTQITGELLREPAILTGCTSDAQCGAGLVCDDGDVGAAAETQCLSFALAIVPRGELTEAEALARRVEYQESSIMDYGQKINAHTHGLGKYDHAAIKFGYGDLVEVYEDTSYIDDFSEKALALGDPNSSVSFFRTSTSWMESLYHPYRFLNFVLGPENAGSHNRVTVPYQQVKLERQMQFDYLNRNLNATYVEVPYQFCSDEFRGNGGCYYFDAGADDIEIVESSMVMLREYYLFDAFKRDRYSFGWGTAGLSYYARIIDRWMQPMRNSGLYAALYAHFFGGDAAYKAFWQRFSKEPLGAIHFGESSRRAFQYLVQLVASPAPGSYTLDPATNMYVNVSYETGKVQGPDALNIELGDAKFPYTTYDSRFGYHMYNHPLFAGSYWEKLAAISVLTQNDVTFLSDYVGQDLDIGIKSAIGFTSLYPTAVVNLFGAIVADAPDYWAGVAVPGADGKPTFRPRTALAPQREAGLPVVPPSLTDLSFKALAGVYALSQVPAAFDTSITDSLGVVMRGHKSEYLLSEGLEWNEFEDPFGKKTFLALKPNYDPTRISASWQLIERANELKAEWLNASSTAEAAALAEELQQVIEVLDMLRELTDIYGILEI